MPTNYSSVDDVGAAYQRGDILYYEAYEILVNQFSYSNNDATEYLDRIVVDVPPQIPQPGVPSQLIAYRNYFYSSD